MGLYVPVCVYLYLLFALVVKAYSWPSVQKPLSSLAKIICKVVSESSISVHSLLGLVKREKAALLTQSLLLCYFGNDLALQTESTRFSNLGLSGHHGEEKGSSQNLRVGVGLEVTNTNTRSKPISQVA